MSTNLVYRTGTDASETLNAAPGGEWLNGLGGADSIVGSAAGDILWGGVPTADRPTPDLSNDTILGGGGNDSIWGWAGSDSLLGGDGDDFIVGDLTIVSAPGRDTLDGGAGNDSLIGGDDADTILGGDGNDFLVGDLDPAVPAANKASAPGNDFIDGGAGNDTVFANEGDDTVVGGAGNDLLIGDTPGNGNDRAVYSGNAAQYTITVVNGAVMIADSVAGRDGTDTLFNFETAQFADSSVDLTALTGMPAPVGNQTLAGTAMADNLMGGPGNDTLLGVGANDTLAGAAGNDSLQGGDGNDVLLADAGNDTLDGGPGNDTASFAAAMAAVRVDLAAGTAMDGFGGTDTLISIETVVGSGFNDTLFGGAAGGRLEGGAGDDAVAAAGGNDTIVGGPGNDTIDGGGGTDTAVFMLAAPGMFSYATNMVSDGQGGVDLLTSIENVSVIGSDGNDTVIGSSGADVLMGNGGNDSLTGGNGGDTLQGGAGNDTLNAATVREVAGNAVQDFFHYNLTDLAPGSADTLQNAGGTTAGVIDPGDDRLIIFGSQVGDFVPGQTFVAASSPDQQVEVSRPVANMVVVDATNTGSFAGAATITSDPGTIIFLLGVGDQNGDGINDLILAIV